MAENQLLEFNFDPRIKQSVDHFDIDQEALAEFTDEINLAEKAQTRKTLMRKVEPFTVNIHASFKPLSLRDGILRQEQGSHNWVDVSIDGMKPADIDIYFGAAVIGAMSTSSDPTERNLMVEDLLNETLRHELIHLADPLSPACRRKITDTPYRHPHDRKHAQKIKASPKKVEYDRKYKDVEAKMTATVGLTLFASFVASGAVYLAPIEYNEPLATTALVGTIFGGLLLTSKKYARSNKELEELHHEVEVESYETRPVEIDTYTATKNATATKTFDVLMGSYALRNLIRAKQKYV